ncbi:hypothetical protein D6C84_06150 [Aureobasidium pullulans]|uniref:Uncharacterized protein n=1 Tax=Aureobasidium pullulans TaxID=5580 RepID=A0A4S9XUN3_AURPU|nr:hypothetical protein D6C84_06150 [Aureobasidium pullulans]
MSLARTQHSTIAKSTQSGSYSSCWALTIIALEYGLRNIYRYLLRAGNQRIACSFHGSNVPILNRQNITWKFWPHCDQKPERKVMQAVQDLMKITPHGCRDGDLILMEGSAKLFNETFVHKRESADHEEAPPPEIKTDLFLFSEKGVRWFGLEGYEMTRIDMEPGDFAL